MNLASSLDGKINPVFRRGPFVMSRKPVDHERMRELRGCVEAVLIGASNLRADNPDLGTAATKPGGKPPMRVVVTTRGDGIRADLAIFDPSRGGPTVVAHTEAMPEAQRRRLSALAELVALGESQVDIPRLLSWLRDRGCATVLSEGGGVLNAQLFAARVVDELYLTLVPRVLGGVRAPTAVAGEGFGDDEVPDATLVSCETVGDELFLRYAFDWGSEGRRDG
jgi:riboflavin-specific deaminase-like protein